MKLINFRATNVHGYLNYKIDFHERLTFLIGINGTGKTSVLKLILGLISPSFNYINSIDFDEVELICNEPSKGQIAITAIKNSENNEVKLILKINDEDPLEGVFNRISQLQLNELDNDDSNEKMRFIIEAFDRHEVVQAIKNLTTPLFLGLDRRVYEGQQIDKMRQNFLFRRRYRHYPQNDPLNLSLMEIQEVIYDYVRIIASEQPKINQDFKNKILLQSFQFLESQELNILKDFRELKDKRKDAIEAFENLKITGFNEHINTFFNQLESTLKKLNEIQGKKKSDELVDIDNIHVFQKWFNNQPQLERIDEMIKYNLAYQKELDKLYEPLEKTKNIINSFFSESKKELLIEPQGELKVRFKNDKIANIYELSSGEKQIVTMLGHLIYFEEKYKNESGIFIIDEPEVSLHLAWQEIFVNSILTASPRTQFILATHSPAIIGDNSDSLFQDLADLN